MSFEYFNPTSIQFGVCRGPLTEGDCVLIPADQTVQAVLHQMVLDTRTAIEGEANDAVVPTFEPAEGYSPESRVRLPLASPLASTIREFYERENLPFAPTALREPQAISSYFCIIHDAEQNKLLAMKRASQFKAVLKSSLVTFLNDSLRAVGDDVFKLDSDFDFIVADDTISALHVSGFDRIAEMDDAVQSAAAEGIADLAAALPIISFKNILEYVSTHKRAARVVASLRARKDLAETSPTNLKRACRMSGVGVQVVDGQLHAEPGHEMGLLKLLDRRLYTMSLIPGLWEQYEAASRKEVGIHRRARAAAAGFRVAGR